MDFYFEVYLLKDELAKEHWQKLYAAIVQYGGRLEKFEVIASVKIMWCAGY
jgi:hypothetical protein